MVTSGESCLVVFARAPVVGRVKTRLFRPGDGDPSALTAEQAAAMYEAFIADVCECGQRSGIPRRRLYVAGDLTHPHLQRVAGENGFTLCAQEGTDLGERMSLAISAELAAGAASVVLIGSDSPSLPAAYLQQAADSLARGAAVVIGPAEDGGYYLIGARQPIPTIFAPGVLWSTELVLPETLLRLQQLATSAGVEVAQLPLFYDVDTPGDLRRLATELRDTDQRKGAFFRQSGDAGSQTPTDWRAPATYAALERIGWL